MRGRCPAGAGLEVRVLRLGGRVLTPQRSVYRGHFPSKTRLAGVPFPPLATSRKTDDTLQRPRLWLLSGRPPSRCEHEEAGGGRSTHSLPPAFLPPLLWGSGLSGRGTALPVEAPWRLVVRRSQQPSVH